MIKRIIFEKDFRTREQLQDWFDKNNEEVSLCFSLEKLMLMKKNNEDQQFIIFVRKRDSDFDQLKESFSQVFELNDDPFLNLEELLYQSKGVASNYSQTGKYGLDLLCIGSSTGGLPVVQKLIKGIEKENTIVIICQHINQQHDISMFETLAKSAPKNLVLVKESTILKSGFTYVLGGGNDFELRHKYGKLYLESVGLSEEDYHPSFNILTGSLLNVRGLKQGCIILSGLGNDGAKHLVELKKHQVKILVQDPQKAVAPYMPRAAIQTGQVDHVYNEADLHAFLKRSAA